MLRRRFVLLTGALATASLLPFGTPRAAATTIDALDMRALVEEADHIVVGTVVDSEARRDHLNRIVTDSTLRVEERLHGPVGAGSTVVVRRLGGAIGDLGLRVEGEAQLDPGERVLLFGTWHPNIRALRPVGMSQGVLRIAHQGSGDVVLPGGAGLALVQRGGDGRLRSAPPAMLAPRPVDEVLAEVRALVEELHRGR